MGNDHEGIAAKSKRLFFNARTAGNTVNVYYWLNSKIYTPVKNTSRALNLQ